MRELAHELAHELAPIRLQHPGRAGAALPETVNRGMRELAHELAHELALPDTVKCLRHRAP